MVFAGEAGGRGIRPGDKVAARVGATDIAVGRGCGGVVDWAALFEAGVAGVALQPIEVASSVKNQGEMLCRGADEDVDEIFSGAKRDAGLHRCRQQTSESRRRRAKIDGFGRGSEARERDLILFPALNLRRAAEKCLDSKGILLSRVNKSCFFGFVCCGAVMLELEFDWRGVASYWVFRWICVCDKTMVALAVGVDGGGGGVETEGSGKYDSTEVRVAREVETKSFDRKGREDREYE